MNEENQNNFEYLVGVVFFIIPIGMFINSIVLKFSLWILNLHP
jgi:hypothetical protein